MAFVQLPSIDRLWEGTWGKTLLDPVDRALYRFQHRGLAFGSAAAYRLWSLLLEPRGTKLSPETLATLRRRFEGLLDRDLDNVAAGYYPRDLLYQLPIAEYLLALPAALLEAPRVLWRRRNNGFDELPPEAESEDYPSYYRRTFHWQSDGWLSDRSARLYDPSVEFLFAGVADVMRRMAIPPVVDARKRIERPRVLDVGCGTGRLLRQLQRALPEARLYGLDLSRYYLRRARRTLGDADVTLACDNAERMPWNDELFDAVVSVFLFHELPPRVRRTVAYEMARVVKPGGVVVLSDSAQLCESGDLRDVLYGFPEAYHEPYYRGYLRDDLEKVLADCGLEIVNSEAHFVSKVVVARRPHGGDLH